MAPLTQAFGQMPDDALVYRFTVQGVQDRVDAKPLQKVLMEDAGVYDCAFIPECTCFKLTSTQSFDRPALALLLSDLGHPLVGDVYVSDGTVLPAPNDPQEDR
ncbi:MAG: hypothetical protein H6597_06470 [Flavobacteriales bacterium]|nr:hypothetical protein [Flavobacteriales bacterium]MCB9194160.1 hypothetical protein [Flavobacteriales bacterium]